MGEEQEIKFRERIEERIVDFPIAQYAFIELDDIPFSEKVRYICKSECSQYGKSWACPPAVGTVEECSGRFI